MTAIPATLVDLLRTCEARGIRLSPADRGGLSIDAPKDSLTPDVLDRLNAHKAEVLAILRPTSRSDNSFSIDPTHPLSTFDWDTSTGYCPGQPIVRGGVRHKREDCVSRQSWRHVWGERFCSDCWPCTDLAAASTNAAE